MKSTVSLRCLLLLVGALVAPAASALPPFQLFIDITPEGGVLRPPPGVYAGPAVISKTITIEGGGQTLIDGEGTGTVLSVHAANTIVRGLSLTNSGNSHNKVDAAILVAADGVVVEDNIMSDTLFGVHLRRSNSSVIRNNRIASKRATPSLRGDGIRLWYSRDNLIAGNTITGVRDIVLSNSPRNRILGNTIRNSRIAMELVFSPENVIQRNTIERDKTGIVLIYSHNVEVIENHILHLRSLTGSALSIKGSPSAALIGNEIVHCAVGVVANAPVHPEEVFQLSNNRFAYNDVAMYFYGEKGGHRIYDNRFESNITDIVVSAFSSARDNDWRGNYWDRYQGFDRDQDGFGDQPYRLYLYSDRLWMDRPMTRFFRASPGAEMIDFVERLAPFSKPYLVLSDPKPRVR